MGVAPHRKFLVAGDVARGNVHAAYIAYAAVDGHYLAVVAPVDAGGEGGKRHSEKRMDLHPLAGHALEKAAAHAYRAYIVVDHPHGHSLPGFLDQEVGHALAELIVFKYVVLHRHTLAGGAYVGHKAFKFFLSRSKDLYTRVGYEAGVAYVGGHHGQLGVGVGHHFRLCAVGAQGGFLLKPLEGSLLAPRDHAGVFDRAAEKYVEYQSADGKGEKHRDPREALERIAVFAHNDAREAEHRGCVDGHDGPVDPWYGKK